MDFVKMEGLGNDFIVLRGPARVTADDVAAWCDRRRGVGADGVLVVTPMDEATVRMEYWNADGSPAEMCGNGLRCVALLARSSGMVGADTFTVETAVGARQAEVRGDGTVRVELGPVADPGGEDLDLAGLTLTAVSVGNPHAVAIVDDPHTVPVEAVGPIVEGDPHFPERTNVEFAAVHARDRIELRVWERGVGETLACGSGAAASVAVAHARGLTDAVVTVVLPGGELQVEIVDGSAWITGPARAVFEGSL